jgi:integrase
MPFANRISAQIEVLARQVDRLEIDQARGVDILDDLEAAIYALRSTWAKAIASGYCETPARKPWSDSAIRLRPLGLSPHKLRHTNCSLRLALRHDPAVVAEELGHADASITYSVYTHAMRLDADERDRLRALVEGDTPAGTLAADADLIARS